MPAEPPPHNHDRDARVSMMHDSRYQITKWRNDIWAQPSKYPENNPGSDYSQVLPFWNRKTHFFLQS